MVRRNEKVVNNIFCLESYDDSDELKKMSTLKGRLVILFYALLKTSLAKRRELYKKW